MRVNGAVHPISLEPAGNALRWRYTMWRTHRLEGIELETGATNTIEIESFLAAAHVGIDDVLVTTAAELEAAAPHRQVLGLSAADREALMAYLRQLDAQAQPILFADGFESGDTQRWPIVVP